MTNSGRYRLEALFERELLGTLAREHDVRRPVDHQGAETDRTLHVPQAVTAPARRSRPSMSDVSSSRMPLRQ